MLRLLHSLVYGGQKNDVKTEKPETELLPSKEMLMYIYERLRLTAIGNIVISRLKEIEAAGFLESKGLARTETEYYIDGSKGMQSRVYVVWTGGWSCGDCVNAENCPTNKGTWVHDSLIGKRCQKFVHRRLMEALTNGA
jgi:hypothetical protein